MGFSQRCKHVYDTKQGTKKPATEREGRWTASSVVVRSSSCGILMRRRAVLKGGAAAAAGLALPSALGRRATAAPAEPLQFIGWQYNPQIVAENVEIFKKLYDENVNYELVPGEYHALAETKLIGGQHGRHDVFGGGPADPLEYRRLVALARGPARPRRDQGQDVPDQRPQHVAAGRQPRRPALLHRLQLLRLQPEASRRRQARAARDLGGDARPVPQAEERQDRRISVHQRLGPAMGEPVLEPVLDLVLGRGEGLRRRTSPTSAPSSARSSRCTRRSTRRS